MTRGQREHVHKQELGSRIWYTLSTNDNTEGQFTLPKVAVQHPGPKITQSAGRL
jgi:hypothetical protein